MPWMIQPHILQQTAGLLTDPDTGAVLVDPDTGQPLQNPDANLTFLRSSETFYSRYINKSYKETIDFDMPLNGVTVLDPYIAERYGFINEMWVGTTTPNGYVLGTIIPAAPGRTFALGGASAGLAINVSGQITLQDNSYFAAAGTKACTLIVSDLGTIPFTITVLAPSTANGGVGFFDSVNGNDANSGRQPHLPKLTYNRAAVAYPSKILFRRGSTYTTELSTDASYQSYGDPSVPAAIIQAPDNVTIAVRPPYKSGTSSYQSSTNWYVKDLDIRGGAGTQRFIEVYNATNATILRCTLSDNINHANSSAIHMQISNNVIVRHCKMHDYYGDGTYGTQTSNVELAFNDIGSPNGSAADGIQFTGENNPSQRCANIWVHDNIFRRNDASSSNKGGMVLQETSGWLAENNWIAGGYFVFGSAGQYGTCRNNYGYHARLPATATSGFGPIVNQNVHTLHFYDNICNDMTRGILIGGYPSGTLGSDTNPTGGWRRGDMLFNHNTMFNCDVPVRYQEAWTGIVQNNIGHTNGSNAIQVLANGGITAVNTNACTMTYDNTTGRVTVTSTGRNHYLLATDFVNITGAADANYNVTNARIGRTSSTQFYFTLAAGLGLAADSGTFTQRFLYTARTTQNNSFQAGPGPFLGLRPTIDATAQEGTTVTVTVPDNPGATAGTPEWRINGLPVATGLSYAIAVGTAAANVSEFMPSLSYNGSNVNFALDKASLSCVVPYTDISGNKSYVTAVFPSKKLYETITA